MNETSTKLLIFSAGCLTGATIAYSILKTRFEAKAAEKKEENNSPVIVRLPKEQFEYFSEKAGLTNDEPKEQPVTLADAAKSVTNSFADLSSIFKVLDKLDKNEEELTIYPITADEYGEQGYDEEQLYFYAADETLVDKDDCIVDPDETNVGDDAIDIFLYTDTENTYIRNNETKTDYEIIKVNGSYASVDSEGLYE